MEVILSQQVSLVVVHPKQATLVCVFYFQIILATVLFYSH